MEDVIDRQDVMEDTMKTMKHDLKSVIDDNEKIKELLFAIAEHHKINVSTDEG